MGRAVKSHWGCSMNAGVLYRVVEQGSGRPMGEWCPLEEAERWLDYLAGQEPDAGFALQDNDPRSTDELIDALYW